MHTLAKTTVSMIIVATLAACGTNPSERAVSGAGLGAAAGTVGAVLINGNPITGAAIGAAAGAVTGATTKSDDIDFGTPLWKK